MNIEERVRAGFQPGFRSIARDNDRYFDALVDLSDEGVITRAQVLELSAAGNLWIAQLYLDAGHIDLVAKDLHRDVTSRDTHGALFENSRAILAMLLSRGEADHVRAIYRAALAHRAKALGGEAAIASSDKKPARARKASREWIGHYLPAFEEILDDYEASPARGGQDEDLLRDYRALLLSWQAGLSE